MNLKPGDEIATKGRKERKEKKWRLIQKPVEQLFFFAPSASFCGSTSAEFRVKRIADFSPQP